MLLTSQKLTPIYDTIYSFQREFYPEDWQILQEARKFKKIDNLKAEMSKRVHPTNTSEMEHADANLEIDV